MFSGSLVEKDPTVMAISIARGGGVNLRHGRVSRHCLISAM